MQAGENPAAGGGARGAPWLAHLARAQPPRALILRKCTLSPASECERPPRRASQPSVGHSDSNRLPSVAYQPSAFAAVAALCHFFTWIRANVDGFRRRTLFYTVCTLSFFSAMREIKEDVTCKASAEYSQSLLSLNAFSVQSWDHSMFNMLM